MRIQGLKLFKGCIWAPYTLVEGFFKGFLSGLHTDLRGLNDCNKEFGGGGGGGGGVEGGFRGFIWAPYGPKGPL